MKLSGGVMVGYISRVCNAYLTIDFYQCTVRCAEHLHKVLLETFFRKGPERRAG